MKIATFTFPPPVDLMFYRAKHGGWGIVSKPPVASVGTYSTLLATEPLPKNTEMKLTLQ